MSTFAVTPAPKDLGTICSAMIGNSLEVQGYQSGSLGSYGLNGSGLNNALQRLNGGAELLVPSVSDADDPNQQANRRNGKRRLKELRNGTAGTMLASASSSGEQFAALSIPETGTKNSYCAKPSLAFFIFARALRRVCKRARSVRQSGPHDKRKRLFIQQRRICRRRRLSGDGKPDRGTSFGYTQSNTNFDTRSLSTSGQSLSGNLLQENFYATYFPTDALYLKHPVRNTWEAATTIPDGISSYPAPIPDTATVNRDATGSFGSRIGGFTLAGGYDLPAGRDADPANPILCQHPGVKSLQHEKGALGADLKYGSSSVNTVLTFLGADAQYAMNTSLGVLYPIASYRWAHQYSPDNTSVSVAYSNDPTAGLVSSFTLPGTPTSRNYYDLGVGVSLQLSGNQSAFISYDSILGISHTSYNSFTAGIRMMF